MEKLKRYLAKLFIGKYGNADYCPKADYKGLSDNYYDLNKKYNELLNKENGLWTALTIPKTEDVITFSKGGLAYLGGIQLTNTQLGNLKAEVKFFEESSLWKHINNYLHHFVSELIFKKAATFNDLMYGKSMLYALNCQTDIINKIKNAKVN